MSRLFTPAVLLSTLCVLGGLSGCKDLNTDLGRNVYERELEDTFADAPAGVVGTTAATHLVTFREHSFVSEPRPETTVPPSQGLRLFREAAYRLAEARANTVEGMLALREAGASEEFIASMFPTREDWTLMYREALSAGLQAFEGELKVTLNRDASDEQAAMIDALRAEIAALQAANAEWLMPVFDGRAMQLDDCESCDEACKDACESEEAECVEIEECEMEACDDACALNEAECSEIEVCDSNECAMETCEMEACELEIVEVQTTQPAHVFSGVECDIAPASFGDTSLTPRAGKTWKVRYESEFRAGETVRLTATCLDSIKQQATPVVLTACFDLELNAKGKGTSKVDLPTGWKLVRLEAPGAQPLFAAFL